MWARQDTFLHDSQGAACVTHLNNCPMGWCSQRSALTLAHVFRFTHFLSDLPPLGLLLFLVTPANHILNTATLLSTCKTVEKVPSGLADRPGQTLYPKGRTTSYEAPLSQAREEALNSEALLFPLWTCTRDWRTNYQPFSKRELKESPLCTQQVTI